MLRDLPEAPSASIGKNMRVTSEPNSNDLKGEAREFVQCRDVRGGVHFHRRSRSSPVALVVVCLVVAGVIGFWPVGDGGVEGLRVGVDLSVGQSPPWAFAGTTKDFPGAELAAKMAQP